jgi:hypothetical protein
MASATLKEPSGVLFCPVIGCPKHRGAAKIAALTRRAPGAKSVGVFKNRNHAIHHVATAHPTVDFKKFAEDVDKHDTGTLKDVGAYALGVEAEDLALYAPRSWPEGSDMADWEQFMTNHKDMVICYSSSIGDFGNVVYDKGEQKATKPAHGIKSNPALPFLKDGGMLLGFYDYDNDSTAQVSTHKRGFGSKSKSLHPVQRHCSAKSGKKPETVKMADLAILMFLLDSKTY